MKKYLDIKIQELNKKHENIISSMKKDYEDKINILLKENNEKINSIKKEYNNIINEIKKPKEQKINDLSKILDAKIDIRLGFKSNIKSFFNKILKELYINIKEQFRYNENILRGILEDEKVDINNYLKKYNMINNYTSNIISEDKDLQNIISKNEYDKYIF